MKFWNKQPAVRSNWTIVVTNGEKAGKDKYMRDARKHWCQQQPGGKFWAGVSGRHWYFEHHADAVMFALAHV